MSSSVIIPLTSNDGTPFCVPRDVIRLSNTINTLLQDFGFDEDSEGVKDPIPLPKVSGEILRKVIDYCTYHKDDVPPSEEEEKENNVIGEWDSEYVNVEQSTLFDILLAANYLNVQGLISLCVTTIANMIKGKSVEQIRTHFNIVEDFNEEEKEKIRRENAWVDD